MKTNKQYLFTGGKGRLGQHLQSLLLNISPSKKELNILNLEQILYFIKKYSPIAIVHLAAESNQLLAAQNKFESYKTNVFGTRNIAIAAKLYHKKIYYISTDYIFDGVDGNYAETDNPNPANWYGYTKFAGELEIINQNINYCIIRTSFRPSIWEYPTAYTNVYTSADYIDIIASEISIAIKNNLNGIIHMGTPKKSMYALAKMRNPNIKPELNQNPNFPKNRFFNIKKWQKLKKTY